MAEYTVWGLYMTLMDLFEQNAILTLLGIAVVVLLIWFIATRLKRARKAEAGNVKPAPESAPAPGIRPGIIAAVTAAVNEYRKTENQE